MRAACAVSAVGWLICMAMPWLNSVTMGGSFPRRATRQERPPDLFLPPEFAEFLKDKRYACVTQATDRGTAYVIKAPSLDIQGLRGPIPVRVRHELYEHPQAPVIRSLLHLYDKPTTPLALETFTNIAEEQQRADFAALEEQRQLLLLFYDEALAHRLSKHVPHRDPATIRQILAQAEQLRGRIPADQFDFDRAKAAVMEVTGL